MAKFGNVGGSVRLSSGGAIYGNGKTAHRPGTGRLGGGEGFSPVISPQRLLCELMEEANAAFCTLFHSDKLVQIESSR